jgi:hypothetical protein
MTFFTQNEQINNHPKFGRRFVGYSVCLNHIFDFKLVLFYWQSEKFNFAPATVRDNKNRVPIHSAIACAKRNAANFKQQSSFEVYFSRQAHTSPSNEAWGMKKEQEQELFREYFKSNWILQREKCPHRNTGFQIYGYAYVFISCPKICFCLLPTWFLYAYLILLFLVI